MDYAQLYPFFGFRAHGAFNRMWIHKVQNGKNIVCKYAYPPDHKTDNQLAMRGTFYQAIRNWQSFDDPTKQVYNAWAKLRPLSGYNRYISLYLKANKNMIYYWENQKKSASDPSTVPQYIASPYFKTDFLSNTVQSPAMISGSVTKDNDQSIVNEFDPEAVTGLEFGVYVPTARKMMVFGNIRYQIAGNLSDLIVQIQQQSNEYTPTMGWMSEWVATDSSHQNYLNFTHIIELYAGANLIRVVAARTTSDEAASIIGSDQTTSLDYLILGT